MTSRTETTPNCDDASIHTKCAYVEQDDLRTTFALALSDMYKREVPLYGDLIRIVKAVNEETLAASLDPKISAMRAGGADSQRLALERHGAIRLGTPTEFGTVRRIFAVLGMHPVGYYDLSVAGLPMHATCFRPTTTESLRRNPFRVFTTLLRPELVGNAEARDLALDLLSKRKIFSAMLLDLLDTAEKQGCHLTHGQDTQFVAEALKTFSWRPVAAAAHEEYLQLKVEHPILADVACFHSAHINHLTPRALDISTVPDRLAKESLAVKDRIEGPPARECPILLRQTSFLALEEGIQFPGPGGRLLNGTHKARFGEIEERGAAVTSKGTQLYDVLLEEAFSRYVELPEPKSPRLLDRIFSDVFVKFPDTWKELRKAGLIYCTYRSVGGPVSAADLEGACLDGLISRGIVEAVPITYEDFLPFSAAGIFQSNLQSTESATALLTADASEDQASLEIALSCPVMDSQLIYEEQQERSLRNCASELGLQEDAFLLEINSSHSRERVDKR